jgi:hypothetical protein
MKFSAVRGSAIPARLALLGRTAFLFALVAGWMPVCAQDLTPRAYLITPVGSHAVILSTAFNDGRVLIDPTVPIENFKGRFGLPVLAYYQSVNFFGRSSNVTVMLPYVFGNFEGKVNDTLTKVYRSGLADARVRFAVNLRGGPAMGLGEYAKWQEKRLLGASLTVSIPTGQYDPARLVNPGTNRWGFKPEIGFTRRWQRWVADWYVGAWFFTSNSKFFPGTRYKTQKPSGAAEGHLGYYVTPRLWASFDVNFWAGMNTTVDGVNGRDQQRNSRIGGTVSVPISRHQSIKFSYSQGAYVTIGGDFRTITAGWGYSWISARR